jgi:transposase InsO family protein
VAARRALVGLRVRALMTADPITVPSDHTLGEFIDDVAWQRRHTTYPVIDDGRFAGLLGFRCLSSLPRGEWQARSVRSCMIPADEVPRLRTDQSRDRRARRTVRHERQTAASSWTTATCSGARRRPTSLGRSRPAYAYIYPSSGHRARALPGWVRWHNHHRPHGALAGQPPISRISQAARSYT